MSEHPIFDRLEPLPNDPAINGPAEAAVISLAISLKRIADAVSIPGPDRTRANLAEIIEGIEMNTRPSRD